MRTKTLLLTAAIGAVGLATSMAQVYSVNIVGYVNTTIPTGFSIIGNPLNASPNNTLATVIPAPPVAMTVYKFVNATGNYQTAVYDPDWQEWSAPNMTANPGEGLFVRNPGAPFTLTFVGEVPLGTQNVQLANGFNLVASIIPQSGRLQSDLGYVPSAGVTGDVVYKYNNATGNYQTFVYDPDWQEWSLEPSINVGEGFFLKRGDAGATWTRTFNVN